MKNLLTFLFVAMFAMPCFADIGATNGVANSATCDSGALDTDSGGAALEAQYSPETINLRWYDNNKFMDVTSTSSDSCTYNSGINLPSNPTKTGYTFKGWRVRPQYDFSTISVSGEQKNHWAKGSYNGDYCFWRGNVTSNAESNDLCKDNDFADLEQHDWKVLLNNDNTIYGESLCSTTSGSWLKSGNPISSEGTHCWCRVTGYKISNTQTLYRPLFNMPWIAYIDYAGAYGSPLISCKYSCAYHCGYYTHYNQNFLFAVLGQVTY